MKKSDKKTARLYKKRLAEFLEKSEKKTRNIDELIQDLERLVA